MKILMFAPGSWVHTRRHLRWLLESGHKVVFVDKEFPEIERTDRLCIKSFPTSRAKRFYSFLGKQLSNSIALWTITLQLKYLKLISKVDVTHVQWIDKRAYEVGLANIHPLVLSVLGSDVNKFFESGKFTNIERENIGKTLKKADLVLVDSVDMINKCQTLADNEANIVFLPIGIDTALYAQNFVKEASAWRNKLNIEEDALVLISIRGMSPVYNHHIIIDAFFNARPHFNKKAYLLLKNFNTHDSDYKIMMKQKIIDLDLDSSVKWIEEKISDMDMPAFYNFSDLIINFPKYDAFPISLIEAAASARPVITCSLPAYKNTFAERFFRMVENGNMEALRDEMIEFVNSGLKGENQSIHQAQSWVQTHYDQKVTKEKINVIYQLLAENQITRINLELTNRFSSPLFS